MGRQAQGRRQRPAGARGRRKFDGAAELRLETGTVTAKPNDATEQKVMRAFEQLLGEKTMQKALAATVLAVD
jgi:hypothetical protein